MVCMLFRDPDTLSSDFILLGSLTAPVFSVSKSHRDIGLGLYPLQMYVLVHLLSFKSVLIFEIPNYWGLDDQSSTITFVSTPNLMP